MARFDRYMLSQLFLIFGFSSIVLVLVYWINQAVRLLDWLIASGQTATVFLEFILLSLPNVIRLMMPIAAFVAAIYVTNRLSSESELVVVQSTGFSPWRLARPVLLFGLGVALFVGVLVHFIVPVSIARLDLREAEVSQNVTSRYFVEGRFEHPAEGTTLYIAEISGEGDLRGLYLRDASRPDRSVTYTASRAFLLRAEEGPRLVMLDGMAQALDTVNRSLAVTRFTELSVDISDLIDRDRPNALRRDIREASTGALWQASAADQRRYNSTAARMIAAGHQRVSQSVTALVVPLIGFATLLVGGFSRFGIWNRVILAVGAVVLLQTADNLVLDVARSDAALWPLLYLPGALGLGFAALMLWIASKPRMLARRRKVEA